MMSQVREIYDWVEETYPFYKHQGAVWWKNCIRHNLSMKPMFVRHQDAGGPGMHMWSVKEGLDADSAIPRRRRNRAQAQSAMAQEAKAQLIENSSQQEAVWRESHQHEDHPHSPMASLLEAADKASGNSEEEEVNTGDYSDDDELDQLEALKAEAALSAKQRLVDATAAAAVATAVRNVLPKPISTISNNFGVKTEAVIIT
jgi:hypothetical protein